VVLGIGMVTLYSGQAAFAEAKERIVHFPEDRSMGMLYVLDSDKVATDNYDDWQMLCKATGDVTVPVGKTLRLDLAKEAGNNLSPLSKLRPDDLTILFCYGVEILDEQLKHISHLTSLYELNLRNTNILGTGLKYLAKLKSLKRLRIDYTHVGDNELAYLSDLPSLEILNLGGTPTSDAGMVHVGKITSLKNLVLSRSIGDEGLKHLVNLTQMESLDLYYTQVSDEGLVHLKKMKKLKWLDMNETNVTENGLVHLAGLKNLERLDLPSTVGDIGLIHLSKLTLLKSIAINGDLITLKGLTALSKMKSIEKIYVGGHNNKDVIISKLSSLSGLKSLQFVRGLTDEGLMQLKNIKSLQKLHLNIIDITRKGFAALVELPSLRELSLFDMEIPSNECWINLGKLTSLERLDLNKIQSGITDKNVEYLTGLRSLKHLNISPDRKQPVNITDMTLKHISKLQSLESLRLYGAKITDEGLKHLEKLSSLKEIDLEGCMVTEEGLQQLKKKLPALRWHL
jgi:Leucine-rich repeat (LRR) protein